MSSERECLESWWKIIIAIWKSRMSSLWASSRLKWYVAVRELENRCRRVVWHSLEMDRNMSTWEEELSLLLVISHRHWAQSCLYDDFPSGFYWLEVDYSGCEGETVLRRDSSRTELVVPSIVFYLLVLLCFQISILFFHFKAFFFLYSLVYMLINNNSFK